MIKRMVLLAFLTLGVFASLGEQVEAQNIKTFKEPPFEFYKVSKGDTFWFIAKRYGLDYKELMRLNPTVVPTNMQIGSSIKLKPSAPSASSFEEQVVVLVNQERKKAGLAPLTHQRTLKTWQKKKPWI